MRALCQAFSVLLHLNSQADIPEGENDEIQNLRGLLAENSWILSQKWVQNSLRTSQSSNFITSFQSPLTLAPFELFKPLQLPWTTGRTLRPCPSSGATRPWAPRSGSCSSVWDVWRRRWSRARAYCRTWSRSTALKYWSDSPACWITQCFYHKCPNYRTNRAVVRVADGH